MRKNGKRLLSLLLSLVLAFGIMTSALAAEGDDTVLKFNNGQLKILLLADCQDGAVPDGRMIQMINDALDAEQPDLVVFLGDNVVQVGKALNEAAIRQIVEPVTSRGIPFSFVFGNHDGEARSEDEMLAFYQSFPGCLTYDADPEIFGTANCNVPVYSSDGSEIVYNLWFLDANNYDEEVGAYYDHVHEDQLNWYRETSIALEEQVGHKVPSMMFQHIPLPQIYDFVQEATPEDTVTWEYMGKLYTNRLIEGADVEGFAGAVPGAPAQDGGQFAVLQERGDVVAVVNGHDHTNAMIAHHEGGIDLISCPTANAALDSYGDVHGYGVITLDESDLSTYSYDTVSYTSMYPDENVFTGFIKQLRGLFSSLMIIFEQLF